MSDHNVIITRSKYFNIYICLLQWLGATSSNGADNQITIIIRRVLILNLRIKQTLEYKYLLHVFFNPSKT